MASKRRLRRRQCERKVAYSDEKGAWGAARSRRRATGHRMNAYKCPHCGSWHIGHTPRSVRQSVAAKRQNRAA